MLEKVKPGALASTVLLIISADIIF